MRNLYRNYRTIHYATRTGERRITDAQGRENGEIEPIYATPTVLHCNVSAAAGTEAVSAFGTFTAYSRTITVARRDCPIDENTMIWFGVNPEENPPNYIVVRKADSKNGLMFALQEVTVS